MVESSPAARMPRGLRKEKTSVAKDKHRSRRQVFRAIHALIERDGDYCSCCRRPFRNNDVTFGGVMMTGEVAVTGECCAPKIAVRHTIGFYLDAAAVTAARVRYYH